MMMATMVMMMVMVTTNSQIPYATGFVAENQTLNAPITDFEVHFLSDCEESTMRKRIKWFSRSKHLHKRIQYPLNGGDAEGVTITYTDHDGDG